MSVGHADARRGGDFPRLQVRGLGKSFGGLQALKGVDLTVEPGEVLGLVGPNGSGKTTVVNCVSGVLKPSSGSVFLGSQAIDGWSRSKRAKAGLIRTYQSLRLFPELTVAENVEIGARLHGRLDSKTRARVIADALDEHDIERFERVPVGNLSYGEQRRVEIARALVAGPRVLLLDEPAAGLTDEETAQLRQALDGAQKRVGFGILIIDHDVSLVMGFSHRVVVLHEGEVICEGTPDAVCRDSKVVSVFLGSTEGPHA